MKEKTSQSYFLRWYTFQIFWWGTFRLLFTSQKRSKEEIKRLNTDLEAEKEALQKKKDLYDKIFSSITEISSKKQAEQLLNSKEFAKNKKQIDDAEIENTRFNTDLLSLVRSKYTSEVKEINGKIVEADKKLAEDSNKAYKEKYEAIAKTTAEYTKTIGSSLNTVFDASSKFLDGEIARNKEKLEAATNSLNLF